MANSKLSKTRQAKLLGISRTGLYYKPRPISEEKLSLLQRVDSIFTDNPMYGNNRLRVMLEKEGIAVGRDRMRNVMRTLGLVAIGPKPNTSRTHSEHKIYPYLLRGMQINRANQVWAADITYIAMPNGFMYLVAIIDWATRKTLAWRLSNTLTADFCVEALNEAIAKRGKPEIFNTDQGSQFTSEEHTAVLKAHGIRISMDGRGRCHDNIFVERLWWTVKHEWIYASPANDGLELGKSLMRFFTWYNQERPHQSLSWKTPDDAYFGSLAKYFGEAA